MKFRLLAALALLLVPGIAFAQSTPVFQSGTMALARDLAMITRNGQIQDGAKNGVLGDAEGLGVNPFAVTDSLRAGICSNSASTGGQYNALCIGHDTSGNGLITLDSYGGLADKDFRFRINGSTYSFPGNGQGNVLGPVSTKIGNTVKWNNTGGTLVADGGHQPLWYSPRDYGAACDGSTDDYTPLQAAIAAAQSAPDGRPRTVYIDCQLKITSGAPTISASGVSIRGNNATQAQILCRNGSSDCLKTDGAAERYNLQISDITIDGTGQSGGNCINLTGVSNTIISGVQMTACYNGALVSWANNVTITGHTVIAARGSYAIKWYTDPSSGHRSDVLNLVDGTINNNFSGADGIVWDGASNTLRIVNFNVIATNYGLKVLNTAACTGTPSGSCVSNSGAGYPQFADISHFEVDGASSVACYFATGFDVMIANSICSNQTGASGSGNADTVALQIEPDTLGGITRTIKIANSHIGNAKRQAALINGCQNCYFTNTVFDDASHAGSGSYPVVEVGATTANVHFIGGKMGPTFGNAVLSSYGLKIAGGSVGIYAIGVDYNSNVTGSIDDGSNNLTVIGGTDYVGNPLAVQVGGISSSAGIRVNRTVAGGNVEGRIQNQGTTNNSLARLVAALDGIANAYLDMKVTTNGAGTQTATVEAGSGVSSFVLNAGSGVMKITGIGNTPTGKQPLCIDTSTGQLYKGAAGAC